MFLISAYAPSFLGSCTSSSLWKSTWHTWHHESSFGCGHPLKGSWGPFQESPDYIWELLLWDNTFLPFFFSQSEREKERAKLRNNDLLLHLLKQGDNGKNPISFSSYPLIAYLVLPCLKPTRSRGVHDVAHRVPLGGNRSAWRREENRNGGEGLDGVAQWLSVDPWTQRSRVGFQAGHVQVDKGCVPSQAQLLAGPRSALFLGSNNFSLCLFRQRSPRWLAPGCCTIPCWFPLTQPPPL